MTFVKVFYKNVAKKISLNEKDITFETLCIQLAKAFNITNLEEMRIIYYVNLWTSLSETSLF